MRVGSGLTNLISARNRPGHTVGTVEGRTIYHFLAGEIVRR